MNTNGYKTSRDYGRLKELLDSGYDVVCFCDYGNDMKDICHAFADGDWYRLSSRGIEYCSYWPGMHRYASFEEMCKDSDVEFIEPDLV